MIDNHLDDLHFGVGQYRGFRAKFPEAKLCD